MENSTQEVHYSVLSEWQLWGSEGSRTEQREKVGYQAVATETANCTGSGSGVAWSYSILSTGAREWGLQSPIATVTGCKLPKRRGYNLQRGKSLQQQLCSVAKDKGRGSHLGAVSLQYLQQQEMRAYGPNKWGNGEWGGRIWHNTQFISNVRSIFLTL